MFYEEKSLVGLTPEVDQFGHKKLNKHCSSKELIILFIFNRIFAPKCAACGEGITPVEGTSDTVRVVAMEKDFHVDCYVCEVRIFIQDH